ncbi:MAG: phosphopantetheine-binding protein [Bacteroidales bacterium]|nr:phosphopantetheine-binding protein [Bacteroidales bacterium]
MKQKEEIVKIINNFLVEEFEIEENKLKPDALLQNDLGLESLDFVDIAVIVEKEFGLKFKGEEMTNVKTLDDLCNYIYNYLKQQ